MDIKKLLEEGNYKEVMNYYKKNIPESAEDFLYFGISLFYLQFVDEAIAMFESGLQKFPDNIDLLINAAETYFQKKDLKKAFEKAKVILAKDVEDPYILDIIAKYYESIGLNKLKNFFIERSLKIFSKTDPNISKNSKKNYIKKRKKMLIIGSGANYADSFVKFIEEDWELYIIKAPTWRSFLSNYEAFIEIGAKIIDMDDVDEFIKNELKDIDIVFRTGYFYGGNDAHRINRFSDIIQFNIIYKISSYIKNNNYKGKIVLAFDGDTFVCDEFWSEWLRKRLEHVDWILFDTNNLRKYFLKHVKIPSNVKTNVMMAEMPLKRDVQINYYDSYLKKVLTRGRSIPSYTPIPPIYTKKMDKPLALGGGGGYIKRIKERKIFKETYGNIAFGEGYFTDFYVSKYSFKEILEKNIENTSSTTRFSNYLPQIYSYVNVPGRIITYLQFGIIPILPKNGNDFYEYLFEKDMAIPITKDIVYFEPTVISDKEITIMRKNIENNSDFFTFDRFFDLITRVVLGGEIGE